MGLTRHDMDTLATQQRQADALERIADNLDKLVAFASDTFDLAEPLAKALTTVTEAAVVAQADLHRREASRR